MRFTKMSLVAALLVGSSAFAIDNTKVSGDAKLYYGTDDNGNNKLFNKGGAYGQAALGLAVSADLAKNIKSGAHLTVLTTLGLEGRLVNNVWEGTNVTKESWWFDEAWVATTAGKTTLKVGRMELDTPLVFTEKWSIAKNTFAGAVVLNQDIPGTTLVGAYVGQSSGVDAKNGRVNKDNKSNVIGAANVVSAEPTNTGDANPFHQFYNGAYAAAVVNNSWKPLVAQAWYYHAPSAATTYWLQADLNLEGIMVGAQYTGLTLRKELLGKPSDLKGAAWAAMVGYAMKDTVTVKLAYSSVANKDVGAGFNLDEAGRNLSTKTWTTAQSKLYTEAWWSYGYVTRNNTTAYSASIESPVNGMFDLGLYYTGSKTKNDAYNSNNDTKLSEFTLTASKSVGPLDATLAYINTKINSGKSYNTIQAYLTLNF